MQQKLNRIIFLALGLIMGIGGTLLFNGSKNQVPIPAIAQKSPADLKNTSVLVEAHFQGRVDSLMQSNGTLSRRVNNTKAELQKAKQDNRVLLELVDTLLTHSAQATDTPTKLAQCDSLNETVQDLIISSSVKDSLYEDMTAILLAQVSNKDTVISTQREQYSVLKMSFDQSLAQQELLIGQNLLFEKQAKRFKIKNKLLSAGVFILSGIATYQLLHH